MSNEIDFLGEEGLDALIRTAKEEFDKRSTKYELCSDGDGIKISGGLKGSPLFADVELVTTITQTPQNIDFEKYDFYLYIVPTNDDAQIVGSMLIKKENAGRYIQIPCTNASRAFINPDNSLLKEYGYIDNVLLYGIKISGGSNNQTNIFINEYFASMDVSKLITTIPGSIEMVYTASEDCFVYKQTVVVGSNANEKVYINDIEIGWIAYTGGVSLGGYALIPLSKGDTIKFYNTSTESWAYQPAKVFAAKESLESKKIHEYSTEEKIIGTWIDGKPIYEKVVDVNVTVAGNEVWFPVVTIDNIKWCLDIKLYYSTGMRGNFEEMSVSNNYVQVWCSNSCAGRNIRQVIVQYTKTTD